MNAVPNLSITLFWVSTIFRLQCYGIFKKIHILEFNPSNDIIENNIVKFRSQLPKEDQFEFKYFSLCFIFKLNIILPQGILSSHHLSFWIDSPENNAAILNLYNKYEYLIDFKDMLTPNEWINVCVLVGTVGEGTVIQVYWNTYLALNTMEHSRKYLFDSQMINNITIGGIIPKTHRGLRNNFFSGAIANIYCSSRKLEYHDKYNRYIKPLIHYYSNIFSWTRKLTFSHIGSNVIHRQFMMNPWSSQVFRPSQHPKTYDEAKLTCRFLRGDISTPIIINTSTLGKRIWSKFTKTSFNLHSCIYNSLKWNENEPNGGHGEECISLDLINHKYNDEFCSFKLNYLCIVSTHGYYLLRGVPKYIKIDLKYYTRFHNESLLFYGSSQNLLWKKDNKWILGLVLNPEHTYIFYNGSKPLPMGTNKWFYAKIHGDVTLEQELTLKFTRCSSDEFTCDNSDCIPIHRKCNGYIDCPKAEDEENCSLIEMDGYRKEFPPRDHGTNKSLEIYLTFHLRAINRIHERNNVLEIEFDMQLVWQDSRLIYYNLNTEQKRGLKRNEIQKLWIPPLIFENAIEKNNKLSSKNNLVMFLSKTRNCSGYKNSLSSLHNRLENYGSDANLILHSHLKFSFHCAFKFHHYPFDVQECQIIISLPVEHRRYIRLITNNSVTFDYIRLLQFEMSCLKIKVIDSKIIVALSLSRIFYNLLLTIYIPTFCIQMVVMLTLYFQPKIFNTTIMITLTTTLVTYTIYQNVTQTLQVTIYNKSIEHWFIFCLTQPFLVFIFEVMRDMEDKEFKVIHCIKIYGKEAIIFGTFIFDMVYFIYNILIYYSLRVNNRCLLM